MVPSIILLLLLLVGVVAIDLLLMVWRLKIVGITELYKNKKKLHKPFSRISNSKIKILVAGDSTATANGANPHESIAGRLASRFNANVLNVGESGAKTQDVIHQLDKSPNNKFNLIVLQTGNNDIARFTNLEILKKQISVLFDKAKTKSRYVVLLRGGNSGNFPFLPYTLSWIYSIRSKQVRNMFMKIAKEKGVIYVDLFVKRKNDIFLKDPKKFYTPDLIHLNGQGYKVWFNLMMEELKNNKVKIR